jgi:alkylated DNA repair dioxygenase AlkB
MFIFDLTMHLTLFTSQPLVFDLPDAKIRYFENFIPSEQSQQLFEEILHQTPWQKDKITVFGKTHDQPRLTALYGHEGKPYSYANITMYPHSWTTALMYIKESITQHTTYDFNTVLINLYRDGNDSNGWHADNEKSLGQNPVIASVSFGATRMFHLQHNTIKEAKLKISLKQGSLLLMEGQTQHYWKHQIPKTKSKVEARINLTFRKLI